MIVLYSLERFSETIVVSDILIKVDSRNHVGWAFKGFALAKLGENKKALKCLNKATKLNPNDFQTLYEKTKLLIQMKKYKDALKSYKRLIELDHENADLWLKVGNLFFSLKGYWGALKCYDNAIILKMEEKVTHKKLGKYYVESDTTQLTAAEKVMMEYYFSLFGISHKMLSLDDVNDALKYIAQNKKIKEKKVQDWYTRGVVLYELGCYYEAINCFRRVIAKKHKHARGWLGLGMALLRNQNFEEGLSAINRAIKLDPSLRESQKEMLDAVMKLIEMYKRIYLARERKSE